MIPLIILSIISFLLSWLIVGLIKRLFSQKLLDIPNERSSHTQPTPRGGGNGFIIAFAITNIVGAILGILPQAHLNWWLMIIPLAIIGILDDRQGVSAIVRYVVQLSVAVLAVVNFGFFPIPWLASLGILGQIIAMVITIIGMTAMINFYNFIDGLDGLAAGCSVIQLAFLAVFLHQPSLWLLVGALSGFLFWNWSPAKIFMGDVGSTVLGAIVAIAILDNNSPDAKVYLAMAICLPIFGDTIYTIFCRLRRRENIFQAHRSHIYQRLQLSGWKHAQVAITYMGINLFIALVIGIFGQIGIYLSLITIILLIILAEIYLEIDHNVSVSTSK